jgi:hypothetical protein
MDYNENGVTLQKPNIAYAFMAYFKTLPIPQIV